MENIYNFSIILNDMIKTITYNTDKDFILDLSDCQLTELPHNIENICVKKLILTKNNITNIDRLFDGVLVNFLEELYINWNHIQTIPKTINRLKKIKTLVVADNYITDTPEELYELVTLKHLYFDYFPNIVPYTNSLQPSRGSIRASNKIKTISPNIKRLIELEDFSVCPYFCEIIPKEIANLQKLNLETISYDKKIYYDNECAIVSGQTYSFSTKDKINIPSSVKNLNIIFGDDFDYNDLPNDLENLTITFYNYSIPIINNLPCALKTLQLNIYNPHANNTIENIMVPYGVNLIINNIPILPYIQKYEYANESGKRYPIGYASRIESCYFTAGTILNDKLK
jgi:hypothetical protein